MLPSSELQKHSLLGHVRKPKPGKIRGRRGRFLKGQNQKTETGIMLKICIFCCGEILENNLINRTDLYY